MRNDNSLMILLYNRPNEKHYLVLSKLLENYINKQFNCFMHLINEIYKLYYIIDLLLEYIQALYVLLMIREYWYFVML